MRYFEDDCEQGVYEKLPKKPKPVGERRYDILDATPIKMPCGSVIYRNEYQKHLAICMEAKGGCFPQKI